MFQFDSEETQGLPPEEVRITQLSVKPWPEGNKVRVHIDLTPFQSRPNLDLTIFDLQGEEVANAIILESMLPRVVITMHLRGATEGNEYKLLASLYYDDLGVTQRVEQNFRLDTTTSSENDTIA